MSAARRERLRWRIANLLDRLPWTCWPTIVTWALDGRKVHGSGPGVLRDHARSCRQEARTHRDRACYCAKFRAPDGAEDGVS